MALQNAFGALELDATGQAILTAITNAATVAATNAAQAATTAAIETMGTAIDHQNEIATSRTLQYARSTIDDAMLVRITSAAFTNQTVTMNWANVGAYANWYGLIGASQTMDVREQQKELSMQTFNDVRAKRWVIS